MTQRTKSVLEDLVDLHKQATTERSHFYVAKTCLRAIEEIGAMHERIAILESEFSEMTRAFAELTTEPHALGEKDQRR